MLWSCAVCTYDNQLISKSCEMCGTPCSSSVPATRSRTTTTTTIHQPKKKKALPRFESRRGRASSRVQSGWGNFQSTSPSSSRSTSSRGRGTGRGRATGKSGTSRSGGGPSTQKHHQTHISPHKESKQTSISSSPTPHESEEPSDRSKVWYTVQPRDLTTSLDKSGEEGMSGASTAGVAHNHRKWRTSFIKTIPGSDERLNCFRGISTQNKRIGQELIYHTKGSGKDSQQTIKLLRIPLQHVLTKPHIYTTLPRLRASSFSSNTTNSPSSTTSSSSSSSSSSASSRIEVDHVRSAVDCAEFISTSQGLSACLLMSASVSTDDPGGTLQTEWASAELFRRSLLHLHNLPVVYGRNVNVSPQHTCLSEFGVCHVPHVAVFRSSLSQGYNLLAQPFQVNLVLMNPYLKPKTFVRHTTGIGYRTRLAPDFEEKTREKFRIALRAISRHGYEAVVIPSGLGCRSPYASPPAHFSELLISVLNESEFIGAFKRVIIAAKAGEVGGEPDDSVEEARLAPGELGITEAFIQTFQAQEEDEDEIAFNRQLCQMEKLYYQ